DAKPHLEILVEKLLCSHAKPDLEALAQPGTRAQASGRYVHVDVVRAGGKDGSRPDCRAVVLAVVAQAQISAERPVLGPAGKGVRRLLIRLILRLLPVDRLVLLLGEDSLFAHRL